MVVPGLLKSIVEQRRTLTRQEAREFLRGYLAGSDGVGQGGDQGAGQGGEARMAHGTDEGTAEGARRGVELSCLLTAMAMRGETAEELAGFAEAMREAATPLSLTAQERAGLVDTCGTGGDGAGTFNISTGAALVAASAGARVAKHGNRAVTSRTGSADVLEALGVPVELGPERAVACLRETGFLFLLATALHPAMRRVAPVRRALGFRTIFNLAGPLTNPAGAQAQVMGVWAEDRLGVVAEAMGMLGVRHALVVHGEVGETALDRRGGWPGASSGLGLDELTVTGTSHGVEVRQELGAETGPRLSAGVDSAKAASSRGAPALERAPTVRRFTLEPEELGLTRAPLAALGGGGSAQESAGVLLAIFRGDERGPRREIVLLNAAAALIAAGVAPDWREGLERAGAAVDAGAVLKVLAGLRAFGR